jgi:hypothetical protein
MHPDGEISRLAEAVRSLDVFLPARKTARKGA